MYPWLWIWAPHWQLPLSGNVTQDIEPVAKLFFGQTDPDSGDAEIEQRAFRVASYGKQLGLITEVLVGLADEALPKQGQAHKSLKELKVIQGKIDDEKTKVRAAEVRRLVASVESVLRHGGEPADKLRKALQSAIKP